MDIKQLQETLDGLNRTVNTFREKGEAAELEVKKHGEQLGETTATLNTIKTDLADAIAAVTELKRQGMVDAEEKRQIEGAGRVKLTAEEVVQKAAFLKYLTGQSLTEVEAKSLSAIGNPDGGYFTARDTSGRIIQMIHNFSPVRQYAAIQTISTDSLEGLLDNDEAEVGWTAEKAARRETGTPKVGKWVIPVHERYAKPKATQTFIDDAAVDAEAWLIRKIAEKFARQEAEAFVLGDGVAKPFGFMTKPVSNQLDVNRPWGKVQATITGDANGFITPTAGNVPGDCLINLMTQMRPQYWAGAIWAMNRYTLAEIMQLKNALGQYIWQPDFAAGPGGRLLGQIVDPSFDHMANVGAGALPVAFANFKEAYQVVDRQNLRILRDPYSSKPFIEFYATGRVGGDVINSEAIKYLKVAAS